MTLRDVELRASIREHGFAYSPPGDGVGFAFYMELPTGQGRQLKVWRRHGERKYELVWDHAPPGMMPASIVSTGDVTRMCRAVDLTVDFFERLNSMMKADRI